MLNRTICKRYDIVSYNPTYNDIRTRPGCRSGLAPNLPNGPNRGRNNVVSCISECAPVSRKLGSGTTVSGSGLGLGLEMDGRIQMGGLEEDGLGYRERFVVRSYEAGIHKSATILTLANLLQEVGCNHVQRLGYSTDGFGTTLTMRKLDLIWVTARMHIEIYRFPAWREVVEIETWGQVEGKIGTRRDFIVRDYANGEVIGRATSKWLMMNQHTRRLHRVTPPILLEFSAHCPTSLRLAFPEENNKSLKKIPKLEDPSHYSKLGLRPRRTDLDMNKHVNNVTYIGWILESTPREIINTHELRSITLDYRRECQRNDIVDSLTSPEPIDENEHQDKIPFVHLLRLHEDGSEISRARTEWERKKPYHEPEDFTRE